MTFEVAGLARERILAGLQARQHGLGCPDLSLEVELPDCDGATIDIVDVVDGIQDFTAQILEPFDLLNAGLQLTKPLIESAMHFDGEGRSSKRLIALEGFGTDDGSTVSY